MNTLQAPLLRTLACAALMAATAAPAATPTSAVKVFGAVDSPRTWTADALAQLPPTIQTDTFLSGATPQTHTYVGPTLWGLLSQSGLQLTAGVKNDVLNRYVVATGSDGYRVVYSLGELSPSFGNLPDLVATQEVTVGGLTPLAGDGLARITAPGDVRGGRYLSNLASLEVRASGSTVAGTGGGRSTALQVSGAVVNGKSFDLAALEALPSVTETVGGVAWTGVSLWTLLQSTGVVVDAATKNDILSRYVVATGSDGYKALFSMGEIDPLFGDQPDLVAYEADGQLLDANGFARLVVPGDVKAGRWVSNLISLEVSQAAVAVAVPEPASAALWLAALPLLAAVARRSRAGVHERRSAARRS